MAYMGDECFTPDALWDSLLPYLPRDRPLVDPFNGARFAAWGRRKGLDARGGDDFWGTPLPGGCVVVSNPPFTLKEEVVMELVDRGVPFILVLPFGILRMAVLNRIPDFKLVLWGDNHTYTRHDGSQVSVRALGLVHGLDLPRITFLPGDPTQRPTYRCACGARVKRQRRKRHESTFWHRQHGAVVSGHRLLPDGR